MADCLLRSLNKTEFTIDDATLTKYPVEDNTEFYKSLGKTVTKLVLTRINDEEIDPIFEIFKKVTQLTLDNVVITSGLGWYPTALTTFAIRNSMIKEGFLESWLDSLDSTLLSLEISYSYTELTTCLNDEMVKLLKHQPNLKEVRIETKYYTSMDFPDPEDNQWEKLTVVTGNCWFRGKLPRMKHLRFESFKPMDRTLESLGDMPHLETLALTNPPEKLDSLRKYKLKCLEIINPISEETYDLLHSLPNVEILKAHCIQPKGENELFRLDNDSLIKIFSYLDLNDWIALMEVSPRFSDIVCYDMVPKAELKIDEKFVNKFPYEKHRDLYETLGEHAKTVSFLAEKDWQILCHMKQLKKMILSVLIIDQEITDCIPDGIENLELYMNHDTSQLRDLLRRLNPTLTTLKIDGVVATEELAELHNLRKFDIGGFCEESDIDLSGVLENNKDHLEVLKIHFTDDFYHSDEYIRERALRQSRKFHLLPMKNLRELSLEHMMAPVQLKQDLFPSLKVLRVIFLETFPRGFEGFFEDMLNFTTLDRLEINNIPDYQRLSRLQCLKTLEIHDEMFFDTLELVRKMPLLQELGLNREFYDIGFGQQMNALLRGRSFRLYSWTSRKFNSIWFEGGLIKDGFLTFKMPKLNL